MGYELTFIGFVLSLLFTGLTGFYPGGIIVPGYLAVFLDSPGRIAATVAAALLTLCCFKCASRYFILFGKRRFVFMVLVGGIWTYLCVRFFPIYAASSLEFRVIGWVIPGLIANNCERQGTFVTLAALVTVIVATYFLGRAVQVL